MANKTAPLMLETPTRLREFGERLRLARLRRRLQAKQVAQRAGMSVVTLRKIERGDAGVTMGAYLAVLQILQLQSDLDTVAAADPLGRRLQDMEGEAGMRPRRRRRSEHQGLPAPSDSEPAPAPRDSSQRAAEESSAAGDALFAYLTALDSGHPKGGPDDS